MDKKKIFVVGGSSGIGLEVVKKLTGNQNEIFVGLGTGWDWDRTGRTGRTGDGPR